MSTLNAPPKSVSGSGPISKKLLVLLAGLLIAAYGLILWTGIRTPVSLGDEVFYYRFAKIAFLQKSRPAIDPLYITHADVRLRFVTEPAWPMTLSWLWRFAGHPSPVIAQIYQSVYFALFLAGVFFLAKSLYDMETALWSAVLAATVPMMVSFGIILYLDLPETALFTAAMALFFRRRFLSAGFSLAAAFLTKKAVLFFVPGMLLVLIYFLKIEKKKIPAALLRLLAPVSVIYVLENVWQTKSIPDMLSMMGGLNARLSCIYFNPSLKSPPFLTRVLDALKFNEYSNSNLLNMTDEIKYFGLPLPLLLMLLARKSCQDKNKMLLLVPVLSYLAGVLFLRLLPDIRYLMPITPFLCILAARGLVSLKPRSWVKAGVILLCFVQMMTAALYVGRARQISQPVMKGFEWIKQNVPPEALILYPDVTLVLYADRAMAWGLITGIRNLFWGREIESLTELTRIHIDYIAVRKTRVYDDEKTGLRHIGGYPVSYLKRISAWPFLKPIFENEEFYVLKVDYSKLFQMHPELKTNEAFLAEA